MQDLATKADLQLNLTIALLCFCLRSVLAELLTTDAFFCCPVFGPLIEDSL